jgi:PAS domain S-box-containing protein
MKVLNNLKVGRRLALGFGVAVTLLLLLALLSIVNISSMDSDLNNVVNDKFPQTIWANDIIDQVNESSRAIRNVFITEDPAVKEKELERLETTKKIVDARVDSLDRTLKTAEGKNLIDKFKEIRKNEYFISRNTMLNHLKNGNRSEAVSMLFGEFRQAQKKYIESINNMIVYLNNLVKQAGEEADETSAFAETLTIIISVIALLFVFGAAYLITISITEPVKKLNEVALRVAQGELRVNVDIHSTDEIGELANSFNAMSDKITQQMEDLDGIPAPLMMIDPEFNITYFNKTAAAVVGKDQKSVIGQKCYDQFKTEHCRTANCATHKAMLTKTPQVAETIARPQGSDVPIAYAAKANLDKNGNVIGALEFVTDLSKAKAQENYLNTNAEVMLIEMQKFAKGNLAVGLDVKNPNDIIGKLFTGFNQVVDNIRNIITKVTEAVQATASAANQISSSTEEMAAGAQEQSSQATEVAGAVEEMTKTIFETTKNTGQATDASKNAGKVAKEGGHVVEETIEGMNKIATVVKRSAETVQELGKSSDQIGEIVQVIDDIADQTNLLALNAAIEAARAGEQGRGFAVVADEVRKLAERTTKATKEIATMIKQIQKDTSEAVVSMQQGTEEVESGKKLAQKAGESLREIITGAEHVVDIVSQVAAASEEQSSAAEQISKNIEAISSVTQESASGIQQIAHASEDLNRLTLNLQELIAQFKLEDEHSNLAVRHNGKLVHV